MKAVLALVKRNCLCFFRDRANVAFSLMAAGIVVMLYLFVLRDMMISDNAGLSGVENLMDSWVLAGIAGIVSVTSCMGALQTMNTDRAEGKDTDFLVTPAGQWRLALGYILGTFVAAFLFTLIILAGSLLFLVATGCPLDAVNVALAVLLTIPASLSGCIIMYALTSFVKSTGGFASFFSIVSVAIGFLTGIYIPMGSMPEGMQVVGTLMPATHMSSVFRDLIAGGALDQSFAGMDPTSFRAKMGFDLSLWDYQFDTATSLLYVLGVTVAFLAVAILLVKKR